MWRLVVVLLLSLNACDRDLYRQRELGKGRFGARPSKVVYKLQQL